MIDMPLGAGDVFPEAIAGAGDKLYRSPKADARRAENRLSSDGTVHEV